MLLVCGMTAKLVAITILALAATSCGRSDWPSPNLEYYHANTEAQAKAYAYGRAGLTGWAVSKPDASGKSMYPHITAGNFVILEPYRGQAIEPGTVARRKDGTLHMVLDANKRAVFMSGTGPKNRRSDGWIPLDQITHVCRLVVTYPGGAKENAVYP